MITFLISLAALVLGYLVYGRFVERIFAPDDRVTPAVAQADGLDYVAMPYWKVFMIQFLNIAGTGPIFGAIMGAKFGPAAYLWIIFGCIFAGAVHDYFVGMLSMRNGGCDLPELVRRYLGGAASKVLLVFAVFLLIMLGTVFVYSPAEILHGISGSTTMWITIIFVYYVVATMLPIDKIIGKIYPLFSFSLLFMAVALMRCPNCGTAWAIWARLQTRLRSPTISSRVCSSPSPAALSAVSTPRRVRLWLAALRLNAKADLSSTAQ